MRKIIVQEWISLDGFAADKNNNLDFFTADNELNRYSDNDLLVFMKDIDTILLRRVTYELFVGFWPTATTDTEVIADKLNESPKIVVSNTLENASWGDWPEPRVLKGDMVNNIKNLKSGTGKNIVLWGSISLMQSLMRENLIDEFQLRICPVVLGGGKPLFANSEHYHNLKLVNFKRYDSGLVLLCYQPDAGVK